MLPAEGVDLGLGMMAAYKFSDQLSGTLRFSNIAFDESGVDDARQLSFGVSYLLDKNLIANAEVSLLDYGDDIGDGDIVTLELLAKF
jgi:hypothetical protein